MYGNGINYHNVETREKMKTVALILYPHFSLFHFAVPQMVFSATGLANEPLFDLKIVAEQPEISLSGGSYKPTAI